MTFVKWATKREAAEHAEVSMDQIHFAVRNGDLPAYKVGQGSRDYRLDLAEVDEWMKSRPFEPRR